MFIQVTKNLEGRLEKKWVKKGKMLPKECRQIGQLVLLQPGRVEAQLFVTTWGSMFTFGGGDVPFPTK